MSIADVLSDARAEIEEYLDNPLLVDSFDQEGLRRIRKAVAIMDCVQLYLDQSPSTRRDSTLRPYYAELGRQIDSIDVAPLLWAQDEIATVANDLRGNRQN